MLTGRYQQRERFRFWLGFRVKGLRVQMAKMLAAAVLATAALMSVVITVRCRNKRNITLKQKSKCPLDPETH